jgi:hypothetical protein
MKPFHLSDLHNLDNIKLGKDLLETVFNLKLESFHSEQNLGIDFIQRNRESNEIEVVVEIKMGKLNGKEAFDYVERHLQIINLLRPRKFILLDFEFIEEDFKDMLQKNVHEKSEASVEIEMLDIDWVFGVLQSNADLQKKWFPEESGSREKNYWLLKMNTDSWKIEELKVLETTYFSGYYYKDKRKEYERLVKVQPGDLVLGYAFGASSGLMGIMEVTDPLTADVGQGEIIKMKIMELFQPAVPFQRIKKNVPEISGILENSSNPPELFFDLTPDLYNQLINLRTLLKQQHENAYLPFFLAEGDHGETQDQLEFENDIISLASIVSLKKINPPIAIGLFGNWGSGKSFFMEKLDSQIRAISKSKDELYVENVVQVKFNSWHYSDANLWASLITEIFDSLKKYAEDRGQEPEIKKLQRTLQVTSQEKEILEEKKRELEKTVLKLEREQKEKRDSLEDASGFKLVKLILSDQQVKKDLEVFDNANVESILENKEKVEHYISELENTGNQLKFLWSEIWKWKGKRRWYAVSTLVLIIVALSTLNVAYPEIWEAITLQVKIAVAIGMPVLARLMETIRPGLKYINEAVTKMNSLKQTLESRKQVENPELDEKQQELKQLHTELQSLDTDITKAKDSLRDIQSGRRLLKFIDERSADQSYRSALGVISSVRKDFLALDKLLREQHILPESEKKQEDNPEDVRLKIDRIVLYIDDLDRCNKEVVVRVLEAIHLLMAFPLFVVIVGVDPRWLNNALSDKYKNLFGKKAAAIRQGELQGDLYTPGTATLNGAATSYDYLEKIFQIPFAIKPVNQSGREKLIQYLFRNETGQQLAQSQTEGTPQTGTAPGGQNTSSETEHRDNAVTPDQPSRKQSEMKSDRSLEKIRESLVISPEELSYMQHISFLFGQTPRTINRYVNIYRIIRTHGSLKIEQDYDKDEFMPIMFLLAVIIGYSGYAEKVITEIRRAQGDTTFDNFLKSSGLPDSFKALLQEHGTEIQSFPMSDFKRNIDLISRFSFRTLINQAI